MEHTFDEASRVLTLEFAERQRRFTIRAHRAGFRIERLHFGPYRNVRSVTIVPGEYELHEVSEYIAAMAHVEPVRISDLLLETELWYDRGFLNDPKNFPAAVFAQVPLKEFVRGSLKSYKAWVRDVLYGGPPFYGFAKERIDRNLRDGVFPEKLHAIKHWLNVTLDDLRYAVRYGVWRHPQWGVFVSQYYPMYGELMRRHPEAWREADAFIRGVLKFPKTERVRELVDGVYNQGGTMERALRCGNTRELAAYVAALAEDADARRKVTLYDYIPPDIELPPGWKLADKSTFWTLGDKFQCCINRNDFYPTYLKIGQGVVAYHDGNLGIDNGALAFFMRDEGRWVLHDLGGLNNRLALSTYAEQAETIGQRLRRWEKERRETSESVLQVKKGGRRGRPHHIWAHPAKAADVPIVPQNGAEAAIEGSVGPGMLGLH